MRRLFILIFYMYALIGLWTESCRRIQNHADDILPGFSEANRTMLLLDTALNVIPYPLGNIEKINYTDSYLQLKTSDIGTFQLKLLSLVNNTKIICTIKTVCGEACDSNIRFYSTGWEEIDEKTLLPSVSKEVFF